MAPRTGNNSNSVRSYDRRKILVNLYLHTSIFQKYSSKYQLDLNTLILINSCAIRSLRNLTYKTHSLYSIYIYILAFHSKTHLPVRKINNSIHDDSISINWSSQFEAGNGHARTNDYSAARRRSFRGSPNSEVWQGWQRCKKGIGQLMDPDTPVVVAGWLIVERYRAFLTNYIRWRRVRPKLFPE